MENSKTEQKFGGGVQTPDYKQKITELVEKIENPAILMKIYTVAKTHYEILEEKEQED